jgi:hypothetical protein
MGLIRFIVSPASMLRDWPEAQRAYLTGIDGRVFPSRIEIDQEFLGCRRNTHESSKFNIGWSVPGFGRPVLHTCSLMEREKPYHLALELARGALSQIKDQLAQWELAGMVVPDAFRDELKLSFQFFRQACTQQENIDKVSELSNESLVHALQAAEILTMTYTEQRLNVRRIRSSSPPALLGCGLEYSAPGKNMDTHFKQVFHAAAIPLEWKHIEPQEGEYHWELFDQQIEWCMNQKVVMKGGPLLDFSPNGLPPWLQNWQSDLLNLQSFVCDFVETTVSRYIGKIRHWEVAARASTGGGLALGEEQRLTLVARILDAARQVDNENQLFLRIDQPWGDYQSKGLHRLSPFQFVDALLRSGMGLSGVNLELSFGYHPNGSSPRELLDVSRLIDSWSVLGVPLHITIAIPSSLRNDPLANRNLQVGSSDWRLPWSEEAQGLMAELYIPLLMAKQQVVAIYWSHFDDGAPHMFPHGGLVRPDNNLKSSFQNLVTLRKSNERERS